MTTQKQVEDMLNASEMTRVQSALQNLLVKLPYGSRLYGTHTATSDFDYKCVYLPRFEDVLLGRKMTNFKARFYADGTPLHSNVQSMPDNGYEMEFVSVQTFLRDWLEGQTYAVEMVFSMLHCDNEKMAALAKEMLKYRSNAVSGMVGFAMKQTFDYVHRGERLKEAEFFLNVLDKVKVVGCSEVKGNFRLDSTLNGTNEVVYDFVMKEVEKAGLTGAVTATVTLNANMPVRSVTFAGRQYLETTPLFELRKVVEKRVKSYGTRSNDAKENVVDSKSLMHAVRVYQQVLEYLTTGFVTFPRPNRDELLAVRNLETPMPEVADKLRELDALVQAAQKLHPPKVEELREEYETWTVKTLSSLYGLNVR